MNPVDRDWIDLMGPETDGSFLTIEGTADIDSHDYVSNLKPRFDNEHLDTNCAGNTGGLADPASAVYPTEAPGRDQSGDESTSADGVSGSDESA